MYGCMNDCGMNDIFAMYAGITGVPHFEIYLRDSPGMRQVVSGAQPIDTFVALFNRLRMLPKV